MVRVRHQGRPSESAADLVGRHGPAGQLKVQCRIVTQEIRAPPRPVSATEMRTLTVCVCEGGGWGLRLGGGCIRTWLLKCGGLMSLCVGVALRYSSVRVRGTQTQIPEDPLPPACPP